MWKDKRTADFYFVSKKYKLPKENLQRALDIDKHYMLNTISLKNGNYQRILSPKKSEISVDRLKPRLLFSKYLKDHKDANI